MSNADDRSTVTSEMQQLIGRQAIVDDAVQTLASHDGVLFVGAAGIGKSVVSLAVADAMEAQGAYIEVVRCSETTTQVPFAPLLHLLPRTASANPTQMTLSLIEALVSGANDKPLVLVVDDLQHSDPGTATVVFSLLTQRGAKVIASTRPGDTIATPVQSLWKDGHLDRIDLGALDNGSIAAVAEQLTGGKLTLALRTKLAERAAGNPFYAVALTRSGLRSGAIQETTAGWDLTEPLPDSEEVEDLLDSQLRSLDPLTRDLMAMVAIGENMPRTILGDARQQLLIPDLVAERLLTVDRSETSHSVRCAHPLIAEHVRGQLTVEQARDIERTLVARTAELDDASPVDMLRAASMAINSDLAVDRRLLEEASAVAMTLVEYDLALRVAMRATAIEPTAESHLLCGSALAMMGEVELAAGHFDATENFERSEEQLVRLAIARSNMAIFHQQDPAASETLLRDAYDTVTLPQSRMELGAMMIFPLAMSGRNDQALELGAELADLDVDDAELELTVLGMYAMAKFMVGSFTGLDEVIGRGRRALAGSLPNPMFAGQINMADVAWRKSQGDLSGATDLLRSLTDLYVLDHRSGGQGAAWSSALAMIQSLTGDLIDAREHTAVAIEEATITDDPMGLAPQLEAAHAVALAQSGAVSAAAKAFDVLTPEYAARHRRAGLWKAWADAWSIGVTDPAAGAALAAERGSWGLDNGMHFWSWDVLHTAVRLDHGALVADVLANEAERAPCPLIELYARHASASATGASDQLNAVARDFERQGAWACAAETFAQEAAVRANDDPAHARAHLRGSLTLRRCAGLQTPLAQTLVNPLTDNETEVALLAAQGQPSKQIAEARFVSARTVDNQLRSIYKKLGLGGRADLAAAFTSP